MGLGKAEGQWTKEWAQMEGENRGSSCLSRGARDGRASEGRLEEQFLRESPVYTRGSQTA